MRLFHSRKHSRPMPSDASGWVTRMHAGPLRRQERRAFDHWLALSAANARELLRTEAVWRLSGALSQEASIQVQLERLRRSGAAGQSSGRSASWGSRVRWAAVGVLPLLAIVVLWHFLQPAPHWYETERGEQRTIALEDGSVVAVNSGSRLGIDFGAKERRVAIERGEAFFEVAPDRNRPFTVIAGPGWARAVGTRFNVLVQDGATTVTVLEGIVDVAANAANPQTVSRVGAGRSLAFTRDGELAHAAGEQASPTRIMAWREGKLHFDALPLAQAVAEHNRYARKPIQLDSSVPSDVRVSGVFRIGDTQAFLAALHELMAIQVVDSGEVLVASVTQPARGAHSSPPPVE